MLDLTKPVQTRDGRKARIICTDRVPNDDGGATVVALVKRALSGKGEGVYYFTPDGKMYHGSAVLINVPERKEVFFNSYRSGGGGLGDTYIAADKAKRGKTDRALALCKMTFEDGIPVSVEVVEKYDG